MFGARTLLKVAFVVTLALSIGPLPACGGGNKNAKMAQVKAGDMPVGGDWTGVFYSQVYGYLHLVKEGDTISGKWRTTAGDAWGEMSGKVTGNLFKYEWTEHKIGMVGPSATSSGRGYFVYTEPKEGEAHVIKGEWGLGNDETGQSWEAVKQQNMKPDPDSVIPDEVERRGVGGGWDEGQEPAGGDQQSTPEGTDDSGNEGGEGLEAPLE